MASNQPRLPIPVIGKGVAGADFPPGFGEGKGIQPRIDSRVAAGFNVAHVDPAGRAIRHEVLEILFLFFRREPGFVGKRSQQNRRVRIVGDDFLGVAGR